MPFPTAEDTSTGVQGSNSTQWTVGYPAAVPIEAGDKLVLILSCRSNPAISGLPAGWTQVGAHSNGTNCTLSVWEYVAAGGESGTFPVDFSISTQGVWRMVLIRGADAATALVLSSGVNATTATPNPPALDPPGWAVEDTLWYALTSQADGRTALTTPPTNYVGGFGDASGGAGGAFLGTARRPNAVASEDPGVFTLSRSAATVAATLAIRPSSLSAVGTSRTLLWDLRARVGASRSLLADLRQTIGTSRVLAADLYGLVGVERSLLWDVADAPGSVGTSRTFLFDLDESVGVSRSLFADVASGIGIARAFPWQIAEPVGVSRSLPWVLGDEAAVTVEDGVRLAALAVPQDPTDPHFLRVQTWKANPGDSGIIRFRLLSNGFLVDTFDVPLTDAPTVTERQIPDPSLISDYATLDVYFQGIADPGQTLTARIGWMRFQAPQASGVVGTGRSLPWDVRGLAGASRSLPYDLDVAVGASRALAYDLAVLAAVSRALLWDVAVLAGTSRSLLYDVASPVGVSRSLPYDLAGLVGASRTLPYDLSARVGVSRSLLWDVIQVGAVGTSRSLPYDLASVVGLSRALPYDLATTIATSRALLWDVAAATAAVGTSRALSWALSQTVGAGRSIPYDVRAAVSVARALAYDLRALAGVERMLAYDVRGAAGLSRALLYDLLVRAGVSRALAYDVVAGAAVSRVLAYDVYAGVAVDRLLLWDVYAAGARYPGRVRGRIVPVFDARGVPESSRLRGRIARPGESTIVKR